MSSIIEVGKVFNGSVNRKPSSTHVVSYWSDSLLITEAYLSEMFFDNKEDAQKFNDKIDCIEQRPCVLDLSIDSVSKAYPFEEL